MRAVAGAAAPAGYVMRPYREPGSTLLTTRRVTNTNERDPPGFARQGSQAPFIRSSKAKDTSK